MTSFHEQLLALVIDPVLVFDEQQKLVSANQAALDLFGYTAAELLGQPLDMLLPLGIHAHHQQLFAGFLREESQSRAMGRFRRILARRKDGSEFPLMITVGKLDIEGQIRLAAVLHPLDHDPLAAETIRLQSVMIEENPNPILRLGLDGAVLYANRPGRELLALATGAETPLSAPPDWTAAAQSAVQSGCQTHLSCTYAGRTYSFLLAPAGAASCANLYTLHVSDADGLQAELEMALSILQSASNLVLVSNSRGDLVYVSPSVHQILGYTPQEMLGLGWWRYLEALGQSTAEEKANICQAAAGVVPVDDRPYEHALRHRDGSPRWLTIADAKGPRDLLIGIGTDITFQKLAQNELKQRNEFVETILNSIGQGLAVTDASGRYEYVNPSFARMLACQPADLVGKPPELFTLPADLARMESARAERVRGLSSTYDVRLQALDGRVVYALITGVPRYLDGQPAGSVAVITDLSERRRLEDALRQSEESIRALYEVVTAQASSELKIQNLLRMGCQCFGMQHGILARVEGQRYIILAVYSEAGVDLQPGTVLELGQTCCAQTLQSSVPTSFERLEDSEWAAANLSGSLAVDVQAYLGTPLVVEGQVYGTLNFCSSLPHQRPFSPAEKDLLSLMAQWIGTELESQNDARLLRAYALEIENSNQALSLARDQAMESSRLKSSFLAMMSHEIRTPMNSILGMNELLLETDLDDQQREFATIANTSASALLVLINDILDLSKIEAGKLKVHPRPFNLEGLFAAVIDLFRAGAAAKKIHLSGQIDPGIPGQLLGDPDRIRQVLINLVGNAIKFTNYGIVSLNISLASPEDPKGFPKPYGSGPTSANTRKGGEPLILRFDVRDTGIGISESAIADLFEPFTQVDDTVTRKHGGTGLGLAISRRLVELMGGFIGVKSQAGLGSHFWFTLPLAVDRGPRSVVGEALSASDTPMGAPEPNPLGSSEPAPPPLPSESANPFIPVLLVEDNRTNQIVTTFQLSQLGVPVHVLDSGRQAVDLLASNPADFALVLMDVQMPDMSGLTAARLIREQEALWNADSERGPRSSYRQRIPIIALTANAMLEDRQNCLEAGMDDYLSKPVSLTSLTEMLKKWMPA